MDLETENRIASILLREAAELRRQAEKDGVRAYLEKPNVRYRPNSRFLTATVLGVQQANKAVETNEMWRLRSKEIEFNERLKRKSREENSNKSSFTRCNENDTHFSSSSSPSRNKRWQSEDDEKGLRDVEVETFLQSRIKRGRGSVGSRMDETFSCLPDLSRTSDTRDQKLVLQSERSSLLRHKPSSFSEDEIYESARRKRKEKKKKHKSKEKKRDKKKRKYGRDD